MNASEIAKIEDVEKRVEQASWFLLLFNQLNPGRITIIPIASDIIHQQVSEVTIAMANQIWREYDQIKGDYPDINLPPIVKLIANHNPDFQPGEEAFALLDDMVKIEV